MFRRNVGRVDSVLRITLGTILFVAGLLLLGGKVSLGLIVVVVGLLALLTGIVRFCVLYVPFGICTVRPGEQQKKRICCGMSMDEMEKRCRVGELSPAPENQVDELVMTLGRQD